MVKQLATNEPPKVNIIDKGTTIEGTISAACDIRVGGTVNGTLKGTTRVVVTSEAMVEGDLHAAEAIIAGTVKGKVVVKERLTLKGSARTEGSIVTARLIVEEGAIFNGECIMNSPGRSVGEHVEITAAAHTEPGERAASPLRARRR